MKIQFCGGVQSVTGSNHLITIGDKKLLLDCGQFQGTRAAEKLNAEDFPYDPAEIDFMILSHAHVDHCGRIPLLVKKGFKGVIYCTDATYDLVDIMLKDSAHIHEKEAEWQNRKNMRAGRPLVEPLYTTKDAEASFKFFEPLVYGEMKQICDEIKIRFKDAGHILGSAITEIWATENGEESKIVFSGDLGMSQRPILKDPEYVRDADFLLMETTYGNRLHPANEQSVHSLIDIILETAERGGTTVIPSFAVGRTQELLYNLNRFYEPTSPDFNKTLSNIKVYVDSPMAVEATEVFRKNAQVFDEETKAYILSGDHPLEFPGLVFCKTSDESMAINFNKEPKVIISASGMCEAGRIKHHLKHNIWDGKNSVVFVGYQAEGTLGRDILDGVKNIKLFGEDIYVNAQIHNLEGMSGHADRDALLDWLSGFEKAPSMLFLVHGEEDSKRDFADFVKAQLGYDAIPINDICEYDLVKSGEAKPRPVETPAQEETYSRYDFRKPAPPKETAPKTEAAPTPKAPAEEVPAEEAPAAATAPAEKKTASREDVEALREKMSNLHEDFEQLLYNTTLAVDGERISADKLEALNTLLLNLEKGIVKLGSEAIINEE